MSSLPKISHHGGVDPPPCETTIVLLAIDSWAVDRLDLFVIALFFDWVKQLLSLCFRRRWCRCRLLVRCSIAWRRCLVAEVGPAISAVVFISSSLHCIVILLRVAHFGLLVLRLLHLSETFLLSVLLLGLPDEDQTEEDDADGDQEAPAVAMRHEKAQNHMNGTLDHLVLAVEAEFALVTITSQAVQEVDVVRESLEPERDRAEVPFRAEEIREEQVRVQDGEARGEGRPAHINLVLDTVEAAFQRVAIRSLVGLALLLGDELEERCEQVGLLPVDQPEVGVHQDARQREQQ